MRRTIALGVGLAMLVAVAALAGEGQPAEKKAGPPAMSPEQQQMMEAWQKSAAVGPEHAALEQFAGKWTSKVTVTMAPGAPPDVSTGSSEGRMMLGGRYVHVVHHGTMMGQPFEGIMVLGYDNLRKKYTAVWVDSMSTQIGRYEGTYDAATKTLTMTGEFLDPVTGKTTRSRGVTTFPDANTMTYDEYMPGPDGKEMHGLHIDYTRS